MHAFRKLILAAVIAALVGGSGSVAHASPGSEDLKLGEYACYGIGGVQAGLGFIVLPGDRYSDLDSTEFGSYTVNGDTVTFRDGHLDGIVGRDFDPAANRFTIGDGAQCEPW